jgi:sigma-B regulation protein RsbU (phosphoserine phosphatase)
VHGRNRAARILSGDFYDYVQAAPGWFGAVVADVSGKGFPAALIAATCRSALQAHARVHQSPAAVLGAVNRQIFDDIKEDMFVSAVYFVLEEGGHQVTLARAGHPPPLVWRKATGEVETLSSPGLGLGIDAGEVFDRVTKDLTATLQSGDCLLVYTDGVNEAEDADGDEFGEERILTLLKENAPAGTAAVVDAIIAAVDAFTAGRPAMDDITLVALQRL